jgi:ligand-binding sensor domain-containing protein
MGHVLAAILLLAPATGLGAEIRVLTAAQGLPSSWVTALAVAPDGTLWIGTGNAGVYVLDPATLSGRGHRVADGLSSDAVASIAHFGGKVYVGTSAGLSVFDGAKWTTIGKIDKVTMRNVRLAASPDGKELWACSVYLAGGTVRFDGNAWRFMGGEGRGLFNDIQGFAFLPGQVLMGSGAGTVYLRRGADVEPLAQGFPPSNVFAVGALGETWLAGTSKGLFRFEGKWAPVTLPAGLAGKAVFAIAPAGGAAIVGTEAGRATVGGPGGSRVLTPADGLPPGRITAVAAMDGVVAAGTTGGLALVRDW